MKYAAMLQQAIEILAQLERDGCPHGCYPECPSWSRRRAELQRAMAGVEIVRRAEGGAR